jgi:hypothetical protein
MKSWTSIFSGAALLVSLASSPVFAQDNVAGAWELTLDTPQGANAVTLTLTLDGEKADGTLVSPIGTMPVTGTAIGGAVNLTGTLDMQGMRLPLGLTGALAGEGLNGSVKLGDLGEFPFTGKRPAPPVTAAADTAAAVAPAAVGVSGKWNITLILTGLGEFPATANLTQEGEAVSGTLNSLIGNVSVKGTMVGALLKLEFTAETPQGPLPITMTGDLGENGFVGKASIAGMGDADWKGVRGQ